MAGPVPNSNTLSGVKNIKRYVDFAQPEVRWAIFTSVCFEIFFFFIPIYSKFSTYLSILSDVLLYIIAGIIGLLGVAVAGITLLTSFFSPDQLQCIDRWQPGAFDELVMDFRWFSLSAILQTIQLLAMLFLIHSPFPLVPKFWFYVLFFMTEYGVFYLLFYVYALIGNFSTLVKIKRSISQLQVQEKNISEYTLELQLDYLISKILRNDIDAAHSFYSELIDIISKSGISNKEAIIENIKRKHL